MINTSLSKSVRDRTQKSATLLGNLSWTFFVLFCFWSGTQVINLLINAPGVFEKLVQGSDASRPGIDMGFGVSILFGLSVFTTGALILGIILIAGRTHARRGQ